MNTIRLGLAGALLVALGVAAHGGPPPAFAATTITDCPAGRAGLEADIAAAGPGGTVAFTCSWSLDVDAAGGGASVPLTISGAVTLDASRASDVYFTGHRRSELFVVNAGASLTLIHIRLQDGFRPDANNGGAIDNSGTLTITDSVLYDNIAYGSGGAIYNHQGGTVRITNSTFSSNRSWIGGGGAIYNEQGTVQITNSALSGNSAGTDAGGSGGAILNGQPGTVQITNSTLSGNSATPGIFASPDRGGGIFNAGALTMTDSTLWDNAATAGGALYSDGTASIGGSIIGGSQGGGNCHGTVTDLGHNLTDSNGDCGLNGPTDLVNTDPMLDVKSVIVYDIPAQTVTLLPGSPAIGANTCQPDCDIGAYQTSSAALTDGTTDAGAPPTATPELGSGELLATGLVPLAATLLYRRRRRAVLSTQP